MTDGPALSVVIPTHNRRAILLRCLAALDGQDLPAGRLEVVVVDDGSSDGTAAAVEALRPGLRMPLTLLVQANAGANAARNRAIAVARAPLLLILNDDTIATPRLAAEHLRLHAAHPAENVAVLGALALAEEPPPGLFERLHHDHRLDALEEGVDLGWAAFCTFNLSVKTALVRRHGGFDTGLRWHEDVELGLRLRAEGLRVLWAPAALGHHLHPMTESGWLAIAGKEGTALASWLLRQPQARPDLVALGLQSRRLGTRAPRHVLADLLLAPALEPVALGLARWLAPRAPGPAAMVYRKLFQARKRRAIDAALPAGFR